MNKFILSILAIVSCVLTACSDPTWNKTGVNFYETQNQLEKCRYEVGLAKVSKEERNTLISSCMRSKGFRYH